MASVPFTNIYYKRQVGTPKPCFVCNRETAICLATETVADFLYTCASHLSDRNFCTRMPDPNDSSPSTPNAPAVSKEEIEKIKKEYEEKQKKKAEGSKDKEKGKDDKGKEKGKSGSDSDVKALDKVAGEGAGAPLVAGPKVHERYQLHRDYYRMRMERFQNRNNIKQASAKVKEFPLAPRGGLPSVPSTGLR